MNRNIEKSIILSEEALLELKIYAFLRRAAIPMDMQGGKLLLSAIKLCLDEPEYMEAITKKLYPRLAKIFRTSPACVEKNIREALQKAWGKGMDVFFENFFMYREKRPGNAVFIKNMVFIIKLS